jgi:hypothetical protein
MRMKFTPRSKICCSDSESLCSASCMIGTLVAL